MLTQQANDILLLNHLWSGAESCAESRAKQAALAGTWLSPSPVSAQGQIRTMRKLRVPGGCRHVVSPSQHFSYFFQPSVPSRGLQSMLGILLSTSVKLLIKLFIKKQGVWLQSTAHDKSSLTLFGSAVEMLIPGVQGRFSSFLNTVIVCVVWQKSSLRCPLNTGKAQKSEAKFYSTNI